MPDRTPTKPSHDQAGYLGPKEGPFLCGRCEYFVAPTGCKKIQGPVEYYGCCNWFEKKPEKDA